MPVKTLPNPPWSAPRRRRHSDRFSDMGERRENRYHTRINTYLRGSADTRKERCLKWPPPVATAHCAHWCRRWAPQVGLAFLGSRSSCRRLTAVVCLYMHVAADDVRAALGLAGRLTQCRRLRRHEHAAVRRRGSLAYGRAGGVRSRCNGAPRVERWQSTARGWLATAGADGAGSLPAAPPRSKSPSRSRSRDMEGRAGGKACP